MNLFFLPTGRSTHSQQVGPDSLVKSKPCASKRDQE